MVPVTTNQIPGTPRRITMIPMDSRALARAWRLMGVVNACASKESRFRMGETNCLGCCSWDFHRNFIGFNGIRIVFLWNFMGFEWDFNMFDGILMWIRQTFFRAQRRGSGSSSARYGATPKHRFPHGEEPGDDFGVPEKIEETPNLCCLMIIGGYITQ